MSRTRRNQTAAHEIVQYLIDEGIEYVFGVTGDTVLPILDVMYDRQDRIRYITCKHETSATSMADAYSRVTGKLGCCLFHVGPSISNAVLGTWIAQKDAVPLIVLSANLDTFRMNRNLWHEFDVMGVFGKVTKWSDQLIEAKDTKRLMRTAFQMATSGMPGPVHLDFPKDLLAQPSEVADSTDLSLAGPARSVHVANRPRPDPAAVARACELLAAAENPAIIAGRGVVWSKAWDSLEDFATRLAAPVVTTEMGRGAMSEANPLCLGMIGHFGRNTANEALRRADVVLGLGCRFLNVNTINWSLIPADCKIIQVETDPLEIGRQYAVEVGVLADSGHFLDDALAHCAEAGIGDDRGPDHPRVRDLAAMNGQERDQFYDTDMGAVPIKPQVITRAIIDVCPDDAILSVGSGNHTQFAHHVPIRHPFQYVWPAGSGTMAFAFPGALGAKLAHPDRPVIVPVGDGDFGMMAQELETSVREDLPVVVIVYNDQGYGALRLFQKVQHEGRYLGSDYGPTDFAKLAEAYGARGELIERPEELTPALRRALDAGVTTVLDVRTDPWEVHYRAPEFAAFHKF